MTCSSSRKAPEPLLLIGGSQDPSSPGKFRLALAVEDGRYGRDLSWMDAEHSAKPLPARLASVPPQTLVIANLGPGSCDWLF